MPEADIDVDKLPEPKRPGVYTGEDGAAAQHPTRMEEIIRLLDSPEETDLERINKLIALEIAYALTDPKVEFNPRAVNERVKALRELTKTLQEGDTLAKKDFLNFDGPKFKYFLQEIILVFKNSLKSAGFKDDDQNHVMRVFRDQLGTREADLRAETAKITNESLLNFSTPATTEG